MESKNQQLSSLVNPKNLQKVDKQNKRENRERERERLRMSSIGVVFSVGRGEQRLESTDAKCPEGISRSSLDFCIVFHDHINR